MIQTYKNCTNSYFWRDKQKEIQRHANGKGIKKKKRFMKGEDYAIILQITNLWFLFKMVLAMGLKAKYSLVITY